MTDFRIGDKVEVRYLNGSYAGTGIITKQMTQETGQGIITVWIVSVDSGGSLSVDITKADQMLTLIERPKEPDLIIVAIIIILLGAMYSLYAKRN